MRAWGLSILLAIGCGRLNFGDDGSAVPSLGCPASSILCDDFESGDLAGWPLTEMVDSSTVTLTTARVHTGGFAVHAIKPASASPGVAALFAPIAPIATGSIAVRLWFSAVSQIRNYDLMLTVRAADDYVAIGGDSAGKWVATEYRPGAEPYDHHTTIATSPVGGWVCAELVYTFGNPTGVRILIDNVEVLDAVGIQPSPTLDEIGVGVVRGDDTGFEVFIDDVAVAYQRIGC